VSYDLAIWCSARSVRDPHALWRALYRGNHAALLAAGLTARELPPDPAPALSYDDAKAMVTPLDPERIVAAFRREYGDTGVEVERNGTTTEVNGPRWHLSFGDHAYYLHVTCGWGVANDPAALAKLRRAALRARCSTYDIQAETLHEPTDW
jgi:hypothetical protein